MGWKKFARILAWGWFGVFAACGRDCIAERMAHLALRRWTTTSDFSILCMVFFDSAPFMNSGRLTCASFFDL
jgi:hypothetical protein